MIKALQNIKLLIPMILISSMLIGCAKQMDRIETVQKTFKYGSIDSAITLSYTEDIIYESGDIRLNGQEALRALAEWDSVINRRYFFGDFRISGDTICCTCTGENDISRLQGIEKEYFDPVIFVFKNDKIKYSRWDMIPENQKSSKIAYSTVIEWASLMHPDKLSELMPDGKYILNAATANGWLNLTRLWREANQ